VASVWCAICALVQASRDGALIPCLLADEIEYSPNMQSCPKIVEELMLDVFKQPFAFQACHLSAFHSRLARQLDFVCQRQREARR
jgi:hypothetical protein